MPNYSRRSFRSGFPTVIAGLVLALAAASCGSDPDTEGSAPLYKRPTGAVIHDTTPLRGEVGALRLHRDGSEAKCSSCHDGFAHGVGEAALQGEHSDLTFDHGLNLLCLNCHHPENSDAYLYHDQSEIPGDEPNRLCAKCHGPHFRDFKLGVHGRTNGYWNAKLGEQKRLACIQCHDPHRPMFPRIQPEPGPGLTRFAAQSPGV